MGIQFQRRTTTSYHFIMSTDHGRCHCGQTEWDVKLNERAHVLCHCDTCKQLGGGAYSLNQIVPKENLKVTKGELKVYKYKGDSGKSVSCFYCPNCTSHAYHHQEVMVTILSSVPVFWRVESRSSLARRSMARPGSHGFLKLLRPSIRCHHRRGLEEFEGAGRPYDDLYCIALQNGMTMKHFF